MEQEYKEIDLWELLAPIRAHWIKILFVAALGGLAAMLFSIYLITPQYQANAQLIVNTRQDANANVTNDQITSAKNLVDTYSVILKSRTVLDQVIETLNLDISPQKLAGMISTTAVNNTQVMKITVTDADPVLAQHILQEIMNLAPDTLTDTVQAGSVRIIENALADSRPVSPSIPRNTVLGFGAGLVLALLVVYIRKFMRNTFMTDDDVTNELGLTVLGVIPKVKFEN